MAGVAYITLQHFVGLSIDRNTSVVSATRGRVTFCEEYFSRLKDGPLFVDICDSTHELMVIPARPQYVKQRGI
ncbi:Tetratricopeptide-like helical [Penicillium hordei]|uniref:Tetratricopeptide-like helical n=1 Tax=Penicillium hordei TaxID=40994 RepID=A0AAD6GWL2_9EURO|nr:Tetratricopeptide-like helical [Penicillium hordei]KAJ5593428.1 Tetratricopeptide-like helical [Penicillium hordei]